MGLPKGFIKNINISPQKIGPEKRQETLDGINNEGTFLPRGVGIEDMDKSFIEFIENELSLTLDGEKVPVIMLSIQRWTEFSKTWEFTDKFKDMQLPFISVVRRPDIQAGTNQMELWNIPGHKRYAYIKVPTFEGGRKGIDVYGIPQPTAVDITYEVRLFCNRMTDLNKFHSKVHHAYNARQCYVNANGHPMPTIIESIGDESQVNDFEDRRFYVQLFEILMMGYLLDEDHFTITPSVNRGVVLAEINTKSIKPTYVKNNTEDTFEYEFLFSCSDDTSVTFSITNESSITNYTDASNASNPLFTLNGNPVSLPFDVSYGDNVNIKITRNANKDSEFILIGKTNE